MLGKASAYAKSKATATKKSVVAAIIESEVGYANDEIRAKVEEAASFVVEEMVNMGKKIKGHEKQVRINPQIMRSCLVSWATGKAGYKEFQASSIWTYPSPSRLKKLAGLMTVNEGSCLKIYSWIADELAKAVEHETTGTGLKGATKGAANETRGWIPVQLLCDEMSLIDGVIQNPLTNRVVGFVVHDETFSLTKEMIELLRDDMPALRKAECRGEGDNLAKKVNQFAIRSVYGESRRIEFHYNSGGLTGDEILYQALHCLTALAYIKVSPMQWLQDAGGNNARAFRLLRGGKKLTDDAWVDAADLTFRNPAHPCLQKCSVSHCMVHNGKGVNNAFTDSRPDGKRSLQDEDGTDISHITAETQFGREQDREEAGTIRKTDLTRSAVISDLYNRLGVKEMKCGYSRKTLGEQHVFVGKQLGCLDEMVLPPEMAAPGDSEHYAKLTRQLHMRRIRILKAKARETGVSMELKSEVAALEFRAYVACIFNEFFLHSKVAFTKDNIDEYEEEMKTYLGYFERCRKAAKREERNK